MIFETSPTRKRGTSSLTRRAGVHGLEMTRTIPLAIVVAFFVTEFVNAQPPNVDELPPRAFLRIGSAKLRHGDRVQCLEYSPDGTMLAAGGGNDPVRVW